MMSSAQVRDQFDPAVLPVAAGGHSDLSLLLGRHVRLRAHLRRLCGHVREGDDVAVRVLHIAAYMKP
jgi:hypothetical protein